MVEKLEAVEASPRPAMLASSAVGEVTCPRCGRRKKLGRIAGHELRVCENPECLEALRREAEESRRRRESEEAERRAEARATCVRTHLRDALASVGVPARYLDARLADFDPLPELDRDRIRRDGLFVTGGPGVGKSHLAASLLADELPDLARRKSVRDLRLWTTVPEVLAELRGTFGRRDAETELDVLARYSGAPLLVLDDLGAEKTTDWTAQSLYLLLSRRIDAMLPTIATSNLKLEELHQADPRVASRLGGLPYLALEGPDRRVTPEKTG